MVLARMLPRRKRLRETSTATRPTTRATQRVCPLGKRLSRIGRGRAARLYVLARVTEQPPRGAPRSTSRPSARDRLTCRINSSWISAQSPSVMSPWPSRSRRSLTLARRGAEEGGGWGVCGRWGQGRRGRTLHETSQEDTLTPTRGRGKTGLFNRSRFTLRLNVKNTTRTHTARAVACF